ncbi:MAG: serine/threonine protein phosphatase [Saprospiraceae bacterium]|nr:serine/threonine protein phosphatase [Saprospiraceae bacterium]MBP6567200.1 serine/threonine protein phosphatase [Saprospiraceae bacterium]
MPRTLVVGDIHGGLKALNQVLERTSLKNDDQLIFLGDYVDGWSQSAQVLDFLLQLKQKQACVFIKGNHDVWGEKWLRNGEKEDIWLANGGRETINSYIGHTEGEKLRHLDFLEQMPYYHIDQQDRLFIHAGFTSMHGPTHEFYNTNFSWDRTLWETALALDPLMAGENIFYPKRFRLYSEIYIGHTPTVNYFITTPMHRANVWNVDTGAAFGGPLTILDVDSKLYWQSDQLPELYPDEKGRNK